MNPQEKTLRNREALRERLGYMTPFSLSRMATEARAMADRVREYVEGIHETEEDQKESRQKAVKKIEEVSSLVYPDLISETTEGETT